MDDSLEVEAAAANITEKWKQLQKVLNKFENVFVFQMNFLSVKESVCLFKK